MHSPELQKVWTMSKVEQLKIHLYFFVGDVFQILPAFLVWLLQLFHIFSEVYGVPTWISTQCEASSQWRLKSKTCFTLCTSGISELPRIPVLQQKCIVVFAVHFAVLYLRLAVALRCSSASYRPQWQSYNKPTRCRNVLIFKISWRHLSRTSKES